MSTTIEVTEAQAQEIIAKNKKVAVYCWAPWCGPCKMFAPLLEQVADELAPAIKVIKLDIDENEAFAVQYNIRSLPTVLTFKDGVVQDTKIGASTKEEMMKFIKKGVK